MVIPSSVRIDGRMISVDVDCEEGIVTVGNTSKTMRVSDKRRIEELPYNLQSVPWGEEMFRLYEMAYKDEKKRLMN